MFPIDRTVKVWDLNTGEETLSCAGHKRDVVAVRYCPKSQRIFGASQNIIKVFVTTVLFKSRGKILQSSCGKKRYMKIVEIASILPNHNFRLVFLNV